MTKEQLEKTKIENLQVSQRCYNALYRKGYRVIGDLVGKTPEQLQYIRNIGSKTFTELDEKLLSIGFRLDDDGKYAIDIDKLITDNIEVLANASVKDLVDSIADLTKMISSKEKELNNLHIMLKNTVKELEDRVNQECDKIIQEKNVLENNQGKKYVIR